MEDKEWAFNVGYEAMLYGGARWDDYPEDWSLPYQHAWVNGWMSAREDTESNGAHEYISVEAELDI